MTTLRSALAAALTPFDVVRYNVDIHGEYADSKQVADAILSDPSFRAALTEAVAEAVLRVDEEERDGEEGWSPEGLAAAIVARMLPPEV